MNSRIERFAKRPGLLTLILGVVSCTPLDGIEIDAAPLIESLTPDHGPVGTEIAIDGNNLEGAGTTVWFGDVVTSPVEATASRIVVRVPKDAKRGPVMVRRGKSETGPIEFWVTTYDTRPFRTLSARGSHACGIRHDDTLWCWGQNMFGQLGVPQYYRKGSALVKELYPMRVAGKWRDVSVPPYYIAGNTCAQKTDGSVWCWGDNSSGTVPTWEDAVTEPAAFAGPLSDAWQDVQVGGWLSCGRSSDDLYCWSRAVTGPEGKLLETPKLMPYGPWATYSVGYVHACAIKTDGTLWCMGVNESGELGDGTTKTSLVPVQVGTDADWRAVSAGGGLRFEGSGLNTEGIPEGHTCALKNDATLWCWGSNEVGQLAYKDDGDYAFPLPVSAASRWTFVDTSRKSTCAVRADGTLWCWSGFAGYMPKQMDSDTDWREYFSGGVQCGLKSDGHVKCFNEYAATVTEVVVP